MAYKLRVILDVEEDVFRDIVVDENINLEEFHYAIAHSFDFNGQEMASFYMTDDDWDQGQEIPLFDMSEDQSSFSMQNCLVSQIFKNENDKLIYVYDFLSMWTFFVEVLELDNNSKEELPYIAVSFGNTPEEAPKKEFTAEFSEDDTDIFDQEGGFENLDDLDIENY